MGATVNMHIRDVPKEVKEALATLAEREHMSVNAYVVQVLERASRRVRNKELLRDLPNLNIPTEVIVRAIREGRGEL